MPKYRNLEAELKRKNITKKDIAEGFNMRYATICDKLNGKAMLKLDEALAIKEKFFPELSLDYLFYSGECLCPEEGCRCKK